MSSVAPTRRLAAYCLLLALLVACSGSDRSAQRAVEETLASGVPEPTPTEAPTAAEPNPTAPLQPAATPTASLSGPTTAVVRLFYPVRSAGGQQPAESLQRTVTFPANATLRRKLAVIVDAWVAGPTDAENGDGFLGVAGSLSYCAHPVKLEAWERSAVATVCRPYNENQDARLGETLYQTILETGLVDEVAVLDGDGRRCLNDASKNQSTSDDPLWCVPEQYKSAIGFICPFGRGSTTALVTGVDEWVNARIGPSLNAQQVEQVPKDALLTVFPSTFTLDKDQRSWITVRLPGNDRCARVAGEFLTTNFGNLGDVIPGVSYELPTTGIWTLQERESVFDTAFWALEAGFATGVSLRIEDGTIDDKIASTLAFFEQQEYDYPERWYDEVSVPGADHAVRPVIIISPSGDVGSSELWMGIGDFTLVADAGVYIGDHDIAPHDEMQDFVDSVAVDKQAFLDAIDVPEVVAVTIFDTDYLAVPQVTPGYYTEAAACGPKYDFYRIAEPQRRVYAGEMPSTSPVEVGGRHLVWPIYCEGGDPAILGVVELFNFGSIRHLGNVEPAAVGARAEFGELTGDDDGSITFAGEDLSGQQFSDTFELSDVLEALASNGW